jgi:hypothetical protein
MTTMPTVPATLVPPSGLVVKNPAGDAAPTLFCMFSQDWITLQTFIAQASRLPINQGDFSAKYANFADMQSVQDCVAAMKKVQDLSNLFGDPAALVEQLASNPAILQSATAPDQLYVHIVWFATKLYQTATNFNQTLGQLMTILNAVPADQLPATLKSILTGPGGLQSSAASMVTLANALIAKLAKFNLALTPATTVMAHYTSNSSTFYQHVVADVGQDAADVATFQHEADAAYKLWRDLTISAVTTSVGVMVLTGGLAWPASAVLAGVLGDQAKKARDAYDTACTQRDNAAADKQKKIDLQNDLGAFNTQMTPTNEAAANFLKALQQVTGVWTNIGSDLDYIAQNFTPDKFDNLPAWRDAMMLDRATQDWQVIAGKASDYTVNSLVTFKLANFGDPVPAA